tara:strand:+ start:1682 stop:1900 length:219 start_codon:yes stop_codon:yes gene_type:complete
MLTLFTKWGNTTAFKEGSKNVEIQDHKNNGWTRISRDLEKHLQRFLKHKEKATAQKRQQLRDQKGFGSGFKF